MKKTKNKEIDWLIDDRDIETGYYDFLATMTEEEILEYMKKEYGVEANSIDELTYSVDNVLN